MTAARCFESLAYERTPPTPDDVLSALRDAHERWDALPDGGEEMCAAFDLACVLHALTLSRKCRDAAFASRAGTLLWEMRFKPSDCWRNQRDALRDMPAGRAAFFALREQVR